MKRKIHIKADDLMWSILGIVAAVALGYVLILIDPGTRDVTPAVLVGILGVAGCVDSVRIDKK